MGAHEDYRQARAREREDRYLGRSVRVEERRYRDPEYADIDGCWGTVLELREDEALVRLSNVVRPALNGRERWVRLSALRVYEDTASLGSLLVD